MDKTIIEYFLERYLPRNEIVYRLPVSVDICDAWPEILSARKEGAVTLPLCAWNGTPYWYSPTGDFLSAGNHLAEIARTRDLNRSELYLHDDGIVDEAYYSSVIEGAYSTRQRAHELIRSKEPPKDLSERMVLNNYRALQFVLEHLDGPINDAVILEIGRLLTDGTLDMDTSPGYRTGPVSVVSGAEEVVYRAPDAEYVGPMMQQLLAYIANPDIHPVVKACVSHIYFVTIHPFNDGNGRTARALSCMILLKAGYDFFRQVPISGLLLQERSRYYKAIRMAQAPENGYDFTYFMDYYADMLLRTTEQMHHHVAAAQQLQALEKALPESGGRSRILRGAGWIVSEDIQTISTEKWQKKFGISFETARQDLKTLCESGFLTMRTVGRKHFYDFHIQDPVGLHKEE